MRLLGIDYGTKRVGLALSDSLGLLAHPYATLAKTNREKLFADIKEIIARENVQAVVLGLPLGLDNQETQTSKQVRNFAAGLARRITVPIHFQNEALSSCTAAEHLSRCRRRVKNYRKGLDQLAAVIILSDYMEAQDKLPV